MAYNPNFPTGLDRGDGVTKLPAQPVGNAGAPATFGTPTPAQARTTTPQKPEEDPASPIIERAEQGTITHVINLSWADGLEYIAGIGRGTVLEDAAGNLTRVLSSTLRSLRGDQAQFSHVSESLSFDTPPDEFDLVDSDLGAYIIKHPRYLWALNPTSGDTGNSVTVGDTVVNYVQAKSALIRVIQTFTDTPFFPSDDQVNGLIQSTIMTQLSNGQVGVSVTVPNPNFDPTQSPIATQAWDGFNANIPTGNSQMLALFVPYDPTNINDGLTIAVAATKEIISKLWRQEDVPYFPVFELHWSQYFFAPPYLNPGAYVEDPREVVPDYFMTPFLGAISSALARGELSVPAGPVGGTSPEINLDTVPAQGFSGASIFDKFVSINPQAFSSDGTTGGSLNISCLRKADSYEYQRTWFRVTHKWVIALNGHFDPDLYTQNARPQTAADFDQLIA